MGIFTVSMSIVIAAICGSVYNAFGNQGGYLVLISALLTFAVTISLTLYAFTTKTDFTMMGIYYNLIIILFLMSIRWSFVDYCLSPINSFYCQLVQSKCYLVTYNMWISYCLLRLLFDL